MKYLFDTNFIYALLMHNDLHHDEAVRIIKAHPSSASYFIPSIVIAELLASAERVKFIDVCRSFCDEFSNIELKDLEFIQYKIPSRTKRTLKANDCLVMAIAKRKKAKLLSFDKKLIKAFDRL